MPRRRAALPPDLNGAAFTTKHAIAAGIGKKRLRAPDLRHPFRGVHIDARTRDDLLSRCLAYLVCMPPGGFFCGPTAALIQDVPLPERLERSTDLHVAVPSSSRAVRRAGIVGHRLELGSSRIRIWRGLPVTEPARTWRDLARYLGDDDLVAAGDHILQVDLPLATVAELDAAIAGAARSRGALALRRTLPLLDGRSASRQETRLRLILVRAAITGFEPNYWVALRRPSVRYRLDIAFPRLMVGFEYQSEYHHDIDQWRADLTRQSRLRAAGWTMIEVSARDLDDPRELTTRIRALLAQAEGTIRSR